MNWRRVPVLCVLLLPACSFLVENEEYFDGASKNGGAAGHADFAAGDGSVPAGGTSGSSADAGESPLDPMSGAGDANSASGASGADGDSSSGGSAASSGSGTSASGGGGGGTGGGGGAAVIPCEPVCTPNQVGTGKQSCGACSTGQQTRTHVCSADGCTWSAWSAWSACSGVTATCTPGATEACANEDSCGQRVCSSKCAWGACAPKTGAECLRIGPDQTKEGSNFQCCGTDKWQFCLSTCKWSTICEACTDCGC